MAARTQSNYMLRRGRNHSFAPVHDVCMSADEISWHLYLRLPVGSSVGIEQRGTGGIQARA